MATVKCDNVTIRYIVGDIKQIGLKEAIMKKLTRQYHVKKFYPDKNISFELEEGDMLGIIGKNGAGKSTLLKAISGILKPIEGKVTVNGTVAALLELTTGFDPDMTVKENIYLRGALLGFSKTFVANKYKEIIDFAGLQNFQDTQFKQLSSGMKSRLAFSVASLVEPDILILDETLSVGDGEFRKKSDAKMKEIIANGKTCILVSHSIDTVRNMCNKVLWLDEGNQIVFSNKVDMYCSAYEEYLVCKKLPEDEAEAKKMARSYRIRRRHEEELRRQEEIRKYEEMLNTKSSEEGLEAAINYIKKEKPEILKDEILNKDEK